MNEKLIVDPFQNCTDTSHTSKGIMFRRNPKERDNPWMLMVHTYERGKRREGWHFPGGGQKGLETPKETLLREVRGEAGIVALPETFPEEWTRPFQQIKSDRNKEPEDKKMKFHQKHWYFGFLTDDMESVPITETDEVIERGFFPLKESPLPDYSGKNGVPFLLSHSQALELILMHIEHKVEDADLWLEVVRERFCPYLRLLV